MTERAAKGGPFLCPARTSTDALYVSARADVGIRPYVQFSGGLFVGGDAHAAKQVPLGCIAPPRPQARNIPPAKFLLYSRRKWYIILYIIMHLYAQT